MCCGDYGRHMSAMLVHDLAPDRYPHPGPFACTCYCRACRFMRCPTRAAADFDGHLTRDRAVWCRHTE